MPYAEVDGREYRLEDTGGEGPPVVLVAGAARARHTPFAAQVAELRDVYRMVTWEARVDAAVLADHNGGAEAVDDGAGTLWDAASDVFGLLDLLGIERAVLGGASSGGELALRAALIQPDRVRAVVLIDAAVPAVDDISDRLDELAMPVLLVHGASDLASADRARAVCDAASDCRGIVAIPDAGTDAHLAHPDLVNETIRGFLEGLPA